MEPQPQEQAITPAVQVVQPPVQKPQNKMGRPPVIDAAIEQLLVGALQNGFSITKACEYAGIARRTFYYYMQNDPDFLRKMTAAQNFQIVLAGNNITEVLSNKNEETLGIRAGLSKWIYEKRMPEIYGNVKIEKPNDSKDAYVLNNSQISDIAKQPDLDKTSPAELLETLETAPELDTGAEEGSIAPVHQEEVPSDHPDTGNLPQPSVTV